MAVPLTFGEKSADDIEHLLVLDVQEMGAADIKWGFVH